MFLTILYHPLKTYHSFCLRDCISIVCIHLCSTTQVEEPPLFLSPVAMTSVGKNGTGKKAQEKMAQGKKAQGKNGTEKNGTKCMIGKNGTIFFQLFQ